MQEIIQPSMPVLIEDLGYLYPNEKSNQKRKFGIYICSCGIKFKTQSRYIGSHTLSCGCYQKKARSVKSTTHGMSSHCLYSIWSSMVQRCNSSHKNYGGRGIIVCTRWKDINNFIEDMYPTWENGLTLDRINNDGNYEFDNCRWVPQTVQTRNTRILRSSNTSGYRGVSWSNQAKKWFTQISVKSKHIYLGFFDTALEAAKAYDKYVIENNLEHTINGIILQEERNNENNVLSIRSK